MKKFLVILPLYIALSSSVFSQSFFDSVFGYGPFKSIEKGEYDNAESKISKDLLKTPDMLEANYAMSILNFKRRYLKYSPEKAYEYLNKSKAIFEKITNDGDLKRLSKIPITKESFQNYNDTICRMAMEDAISKNDVKVYQNYLKYYLLAPKTYITKITENRNALAFLRASTDNTEESFNGFIAEFPDAVQLSDATQKRNNLAYEKAKKADKIEAYDEFIKKYPAASEVNPAWERVYELAYSQAEKENNTQSYKKFIDTYPKSKQFEKANALYDKFFFYDYTNNANWKKYKLYIETYPKTAMISVAQDSILSQGIQTDNLDALLYCYENLTGSKKTNALLKYYEIFTIDGEKQTLDMFYSKFSDDTLKDVKLLDYKLAALGDELKVQLPYVSDNFLKYDEYIRLAAPREKAFTALQKMISTDITTKNWKSAILKLKTYVVYFGNKNKKITDLISFFESQLTKSEK
ncbi:MAG: hypothetical protein WCL70_09730 [Paludibacter sp.]